MALITNTTLGRIKDQVATQNVILKDFVETYATSTWDTVQADVRAGKASENYAIGDELICKYTTNGVEYDFPWVVVDIDRDITTENGATKKALILQAKYGTLEEVQFDAAENTIVESSETTAADGWYYFGVSDGNYTALNLSTGDTIPHSSYDSIRKTGINHVDAARYGYNRYRDSAQRQWLNSSAPRNLWWEPKHLGDVAPSQLATVDGFMHGLDSDFLAVVNPVKIQVATNTVTDGGVTDVMYDRFWMPSIEEMYGFPQAAGVEGAYFPYWKTVTGLSNPSNGSSTDTNDARKIPHIGNPTGSSVNLRLRSANRGHAYIVWHVNSTGYLNTNAAYNSYRTLPACAIY